MKNPTFSHFHQHKTAAKPLYKIPKTKPKSQQERTPRLKVTKETQQVIIISYVPFNLTVHTLASLSSRHISTKCFPPINQSPFLP